MMRYIDMTNWDELDLYIDELLLVDSINGVSSYFVKLREQDLLEIL